MPKGKNSTKNTAVKKRRPAITPDAREKQMISLATDLAERKLADGTAPASVITHYLKLGTEREKLEREKLAYEKEMIKAKTEALQSAKRVEELYTNALAAMRRYSGHGDEYDYEEG